MKKQEKGAQLGVCASQAFFLPCAASDGSCCLTWGAWVEGYLEEVKGIYSLALQGF